MILDFHEKGKVKISMRDYVKNTIDEFPEYIDRININTSNRKFI